GPTLAASALVHAERYVELAVSATTISEPPTPEPVLTPDQLMPVLATSGLDWSTIGIRPEVWLQLTTGAAANWGARGLDSSSTTSLEAATRSATPRNATFRLASAITARMERPGRPPAGPRLAE